MIRVVGQGISLVVRDVELSMPVPEEDDFEVSWMQAVSRTVEPSSVAEDGSRSDYVGPLSVVVAVLKIRPV